MLKRLNAILSLLPFNGDKLKLSGLFLAVTQIMHLIPGLDWKELFFAILENPTKAGLIAAVLAAVHKLIKANIPDPT